MSDKIKIKLYRGAYMFGNHWTAIKSPDHGGWVVRRPCDGGFEFGEEVDTLRTLKEAQEIYG